jgi:superfamily II DNA or RNA helicase
MITPRPYQTEAVNAILREWNAGVTRQLVSLPTGSGKTIIFALLAQKLGLRTLVLAHREELLQQAAAKMRLVNPAINAGILRARDSTGYYTDVCIASVQTAARANRLEALRGRDFRLCVVDEAHHAASESYIRILRELGFLDDDPDTGPNSRSRKLLVGVTATAFRGDGIALGGVFDKVVFERTVLAMIKAGYLCDARGISVKTGADLGGVHTARGDFVQGELSDVIDIPARNRLIAETYIEWCEGRKAVVFCAGVEHAQNVSDAFRDAGVTCYPIWGDMPHSERSAKLRAYENGDISVLCNCAVLTEGWDDPATSAVLLARPTKSRALYVQMVGRGLRTYPGKADCLVVDFADMAGRHDMCGFATLAGDLFEGRVKPKERQTILDAAEEFEGLEDARQASLGLNDVSFEEIDVFGRSDFVWTPVKGGHFRISVSDTHSLWVRREEEGYAVWLLNRFDYGDKTKISDEPLPLGYAQGEAEDYIRLHAARHLVAKDAAWRRRPATQKQIEALSRMKIPHGPDISSGEASALIDAEMARREAARNEPATRRQMWLLRHRLGFDVREGLTKGEASRMIASAKREAA